MRDNIKPVWEDPENVDGGCWSYKITKRDAYRAWIELSTALIGETILNTNTTEINGISISPKKGFCIIKIWNNNSKYSDTKFIVNTIPYIVNEESIYKAFSENKN